MERNREDLSSPGGSFESITINDNLDLISKDVIIQR